MLLDHRQKRPNKVTLIVKISAQVFGLIFVVFAMRQLQQGQTNLQTLFDSGKESSWCPSDTIEVELIGRAVRITSLEQIRALCHYSPETMDVDSVGQAKYEAKLVARNGERAEKTLEADAQSHTLRIDGLPFKSKKIWQAIESQVAE